MTSGIHLPLIALTFLTNFFNPHNHHKLRICHRDFDVFSYIEIDDRDWNKYSRLGAYFFDGHDNDDLWHKNDWCRHHHHSPPSVPEYSLTTGLLATATAAGAFLAIRRSFLLK